ncbi:conserved Plasmodium protein, unknown function [Plasmodium sp. gorilla clade G2]|uniref:conserved Plasmodium protein, unknown function n=1 Tax=Plasmodium sp. gorilla clade G2 TaxID=880535 RepID=UPI000D201610|nr:conserved Plasmodium protein, unknown function [Plasmodium sp. gorilla clade G2]SOV14878.1 conserved Plasmodium protein, unknown function [Plasmodium sp. gorilla clade G2]
MDNLTLESFYKKKKESFNMIYWSLRKTVLSAKGNQGKNMMAQSLENKLLAMLFLTSNYYIMNNNNIFLKHVDKYYKGIKKNNIKKIYTSRTIYKILLKRINYKLYNIFLKTLKHKERENIPDIKYTLYNININKNIQEEYLCNIFDKYFKTLLSYLPQYKGKCIFNQFYNIDFICDRNLKIIRNIKKNNKYIIYHILFL